MQDWFSELLEEAGFTTKLLSLQKWQRDFIAASLTSEL